MEEYSLLSSPIIRTRDTSLSLTSTGSVLAGQTGYDSGTGFWLGVVDGTPKLSIGNSSGDKMTWDGDSLDITGNLTATTGTIGGFTIGATTITGTNLILDSSGQRITLGSGNDIIILDADEATYRLWVGNATAASAPFRVAKDGSATATNITITGGSVDGVTLVVGSVATAALADGAITTIKLGAASVTTEKIGDTQITEAKIGASAVTETKIGAGAVVTAKIGDLAVTTGKLVDDAVTTAKITAQAVTTNEIAANTIVAGNIAAATITSNEIASNTIVAANIAAGTITATEIAASTITAAKMNVTTLSSIAADLGTITAGTITLPSGGHVKSGQTAYDTGTGFWLGNDAGTVKFSIGNSAGNKLTWNGTTLGITGTVTASAGTIGGFTLSSGALTATNLAISSTGQSISLGSLNDIIILDADDATYRVWVGNATAASAPFRVTKAGALTATSATITGSITSTSGTIGGFTLAASTLTATNLILDSSGQRITLGSGNNVVILDADDANFRLWIGNATNSSAPFRVTPAGVVTATNITISGGSVVTSVLSGLVSLANTNVAAQGWTQTCAFSVTDADTVAWGAGTFRTAGGTSYSIGAGNTGNMAAKTYIYLDIGVSTTAYQTTTTATTAVGAGKVLVAVAQNGTGEATFSILDGGGININATSIVAGSIVAANIAAATITGSLIAADTITGSNIAAATITATELSVSELSAISADLGDITAGTIVFPSGGFLRSGQTAYDTGTGFYLGNDAGTPKFSIGNSAGNKLTWNGTTLSITGAVTATTGSIGGFTIGATTITGGSITLDSTGNIRAGQTAYNTGTGFWLGVDSGTPKFSIGSAASNIRWDGTNILLDGTLKFGANFSVISTDTADGSDTKQIVFCGGGGAGGGTRGGQLLLSGNEHALTPGFATLNAGAGVGACAKLIAAGSYVSVALNGDIDILTVTNLDADINLLSSRDVYIQGSKYSRKNAIINGDFNVWQRGTSFAAVASGAYTADRWVYGKLGSSAAHTVSRSTDVPTVAQAGRLYNYSILIDCTTADAAVAIGDVIAFQQSVEGYNWLPLAQRALILSFWVKATKTGTYCVAFRNSGADRSYVGEYTVDTTATWEKKTIAVSASPSAGTWEYATGVGITIGFALICGTTFQTTAGAWQTGNFLGTANQVNACDNVANDFRITGVQLEVGSAATEFEYRTYADELKLCQRYYQASFTNALATAFPASNANATNCVATATNVCTHNQQFTVPMRAAPTVTHGYNSTPNQMYRINTGATIDQPTNNCPVSDTGFNYISSSNTNFVTGEGYSWHWSATAEL